MGIQIRITATNSFDGLTPVPDDAQLALVSKGIFRLVDSGGNALVDVGQISMLWLLEQDLFATDSVYFPSIAHDGGGGATTLTAMVLMPLGGGGSVQASPARRGDVAPSGGYVGPLALLGPGDILSLDSGVAGAGDQEVVLNIVVMPEGRLVDVGEAFAEDPAAELGFVGVYIENATSAGAGVNRLAWGRSTATIDKISVVTNQAVATGDLVITAAIDGVAITGGVVTIPAGSPAGTIVDEFATALKEIPAGSDLSFTVSGGNTTTPASANVTVDYTPIA